MSDHGEAPKKPITRRIPLLAAWDELLGQIDVKTYKMALYRLASYCSFIGISPDQVNAAILVNMYEALETEEIVKNPRPDPEAHDCHLEHVPPSGARLARRRSELALQDRGRIVSAGGVSPELPGRSRSLEASRDGARTLSTRMRRRGRCARRQ